MSAFETIDERNHRCKDLWLEVFDLTLKKFESVSKKDIVHAGEVADLAVDVFITKFEKLI